MLLAAAGVARWGRFSGVAVSGCLGPGEQVRASLTDSRPYLNGENLPAPASDGRAQRSGPSRPPRPSPHRAAPAAAREVQPL